MKGLAICSLLFCVLALVLVYAATSGMGIRTPSFAPSLHEATVERRPQIIEPQPVVDIERASPVANANSSIPKPEVTVTRVSRKRKHTAKKSITTTTEPVKSDAPKPAAAQAKPPIEKPKPKVETRPAPVQTAPEPKPQEPVVHPRDVSDSGPLTTSDVEWRKQTLERWRREEQERRDGSINRSFTTSKPGQDSELKGTPAEGLFPADDQRKSDKKKKKRHRFLFIRW